MIPFSQKSSFILKKCLFLSSIFICIIKKIKHLHLQKVLEPIVSYPLMARPSFRAAISYCWMETQKGLKYAGTLYYRPTLDSAPNMECRLSNKKRLKGAVLYQIGLNFCSWAPENSFWVNLSIELTEPLTHNFWVKLRQ